MKKFFLSTAVLAMFVTGCQNEIVVENQEIQQGGQLITLEVCKGLDSRTVLGDNNATLWSAGDEIYVTGNNGKVTGVLKLKQGADSSNGLFEGYVFGGTQLDYVVFPVPQDGKIDMAARENGKLNAPMIGTVSENGASLKNVGGIIAFNSDQVYPAEAKNSEGKNLTSGSYTFNPRNGTLTYSAGQQGNYVPTYVKNGKAYLPVATTFNATKGDETEPLSGVTVEVNVQGTSISLNNVTVTPNEIYGDDDNENTDDLDVKVIDCENDWYEAFVNGGTYQLKASFDVDKKVALKDGKTLTIIGNGNNLVFKNGTTEGITGIRAIGVYNSNLTIKDLNMDVIAGESANGIYMEGKESNESYLKLENCTMKASIKTFVLITEKSYAEITGGHYTFNGGSDASRYAIKLDGGAEALINTTINGGMYGGGLTIHNSSATINGIHFEGGETNSQHGLHIWGSNVDYEEDAEKLYVDDVYVQTKGEGTSTDTATSVVNGATFEAGTNYGVATGFIGTMEELKEKIENIKKEQNQSME